MTFNRRCIRFFCLSGLLILLSHDSSPQETHAPVLYVNKIPPEGFLLDKDWRCQLGDDPRYADPRYDDRQWQPIDPTPDIHDIPVLWKNSILWMRLRFKIDSSLVGRLAMAINQS